MSLLKRHIGRRVAGVGVGVALLMLGLEAPAFAALGITSFTPTSGPAIAADGGDGCVISIIGTDFTNPNVNNVEFTQAGDTFATGPTLDAFDFAVKSGTEIWATVPTGALTGPIAVTNTQGTKFSSASSFTVTTGAAADPCGPTVASFTPTCGVVGTAVTITGTNLLQNSGDDSPAADPVGGNVQFAPYGANATPTGVAPSLTKISVNVPASAADGPIRVTTWAPGAGGTLDTTATFDVVTDPTTCEAPVPWARNITLKLKDKLVAKGTVTAIDAAAPAECTAGVPVKIQRKKKGDGWKTVGKTTTGDTGAYSKKIKNKKGKYRSRAVKITLASGEVCGKATSPVRKH